MSAGLALTDMACVRGGRLLFEALTLALSAGEAALVTGPNGVGKSSLLRIAAGLLPPAAGRIDRFGTIALVDERAALDPRATVAEALRFWARIDRMSGDGVNDALEAMGIAALAPVPVRMLSTGQRKRAALARTIAGSADIWLLDEPGNGLDAAALDRLAAAMAAHRARGGIVLAASHQTLGLPNAITLDLGGSAA